MDAPMNPSGCAQNKSWCCTLSHHRLISSLKRSQCKRHNNKIYLIDFGSVQNAVNLPQRTITIVGTYGYMQMEQFGGQTVPASDLYSLGATLIYLMTGRHPAELPQDEGRIAFEQVINLSSGLANWLRLMIEPSLKRRLNSAKVALDFLEEIHQKTQKFNVHHSKIVESAKLILW